MLSTENKQCKRNHVKLHYSEKTATMFRFYGISTSCICVASDCIYCHNSALLASPMVNKTLI